MAKQKKTKTKRKRPATIATLFQIEVGLKRRVKVEAYLQQTSLSKFVNDALRSYLLR